MTLLQILGYPNMLLNLPSQKRLRNNPARSRNDEKMGYSSKQKLSELFDLKILKFISWMFPSKMLIVAAELMAEQAPQSRRRYDSVVLVES